MERVYSFVAQEIAAGRQAYVVYPIVEETETSADIKAAEKMFLHLSEKVFPRCARGLAAWPDEREHEGVHRCVNFKVGKLKSWWQRL